MTLENIYNHAPIWMQNVMCSVKGWTIAQNGIPRDSCWN